MQEQVILLFLKENLKIRYTVDNVEEFTRGCWFVKETANQEPNKIIAFASVFHILFEFRIPNYEQRTRKEPRFSGKNSATNSLTLEKPIIHQQKLKIGGNKLNTYCIVFLLAL